MDKTLIVSLHGIRTKQEDPKEWQLLFDKWLRENYPKEIEDGTLVHLPFSYGVVSVFRFLTVGFFTWLRMTKVVNHIAISKFTKFLTDTIPAYPGYDIHIISHSFGTWVSHETLKNNPGIKAKSVHLIGGIISAHIRNNWLDELLMTKQIQKCIIWSSHSDGVVRFATPPYGHIGYWGAITEDDRDRIKPPWQPFTHLALFNRATNFGHSDYFIPETFHTLMGDILNGHE